MRLLRGVNVNWSVRMAGFFLAFAVLPVFVGLRRHGSDAGAEEAKPSSAAPSTGAAEIPRQASEERIVALEQSVKALQANLAKLHAELPRLIARAEATARLGSEFLAGMHPNPVPLSQEGLPPRKLPPSQSLARRRQGIKSWSTLERPGGEVPQKPRKLSKGEMVDAYFRACGGPQVIDEVVHALERLDEDIRFSQNGDQLSVRATRAGQEVVRQLIDYYEEQLNPDE